MFYLCKLLSFLDISNFDFSQVTDMSYIFYNCSSLTSLNLTNLKKQIHLDLMEYLKVVHH